LKCAAIRSLGEKGRIFAGREALHQQRIELVELGLRGVFMVEASGALQLADDRIEGAVGMLRRAEVSQPRLRPGRDAFEELGRQARFTDARLAR
jgi:hypothetical protein